MKENDILGAGPGMRARDPPGPRDDLASRRLPAGVGSRVMQSKSSAGRASKGCPRFPACREQQGACPSPSTVGLLPNPKGAI